MAGRSGGGRLGAAGAASIPTAGLRRVFSRSKVGGFSKGGEIVLVEGVSIGSRSGEDRTGTESADLNRCEMDRAEMENLSRKRAAGGGGGWCGERAVKSSGVGLSSGVVVEEVNGRAITAWLLVERSWLKCSDEPLPLPLPLPCVR